MKRAQILLAADLGSSDERSQTTSPSGLRRFSERNGGLSKKGSRRRSASFRDPEQIGSWRRGGGDALRDGLLRAPAGRSRWSLELLAGEMVRLTVHGSSTRRSGVDSARFSSNPGRRRCGASPRSMRNSSRAWRMCWSSMPRDRPSTHRRLLRRDAAATHRRGTIPGEGRAWKARRFDYEYVRNGTANVFMFVDAHRSWRHAKVTDRRTCIDFAECLRAIERARQKLGAQLPQSRPTTGPGRRLNRSSSLGPGTRSAEQSVVWRIVWSTPVSRILWVPARPLIDLDVVEIDPHCVRAVVIDGIKCQYDVPPRP